MNLNDVKGCCHFSVTIELKNHFSSGSQHSKQPRITPRAYGLEEHISLNAMLGKETSQHVPWGPWLRNERKGAQPHDLTKGPSPGPNRAAFLLLFYNIFQNIS